MGTASDVITALLGGGLVIIITAVGKAIREWRAGRLATEDTAISRWKELAKEREEEADKAWRLVAKYRRTYPQLWAAYMTYPGDNKIQFPPDPSDPSLEVAMGTVFTERISDGPVSGSDPEADHSQQGS